MRRLMRAMLVKLYSVSYSSSILRKMIWGMRLISVLRPLYYLLFGLGMPRDGILRVCLDNIEAVFKVESPMECHIVSSLGGERHILRSLLEECRAGDVFWDVGANIGLYSVFIGKALQNVGTVVAFEPCALASARLSQNVVLNGISNVLLVRKALGAHGGRGTLRVDPTRCWVTSGLSTRVIGAMNEEEEVEVISGDEAVSSGLVPPPTVVKIDVEGFEVHVLQGMRRLLSNPNCRTCCCEVHTSFMPKDISPARILQFLRECGFVHFSKLHSVGRYNLLAHKHVPSAVLT